MAMSGGLLLSCMLITAGSADAARSRELALYIERSGYAPTDPAEYLVTREGEVYRLLGIRQVPDPRDPRPISLISWLCDSRDPAKARAAARKIVSALGAVVRGGGMTTLVVQARVGFKPASMSTSYVYNVSFEFRDGRWIELEEDPPDKRPIGFGPLDLADDPAFPLDEAGLRAASAFGVQWWGAVDRKDWDELRRMMGGSYLAALRDPNRQRQFESDMTRLAELRKGGNELLETGRFQGRPESPGAWSKTKPVMLYYSVGTAGRLLGFRQLAVSQEEDQWKVLGFRGNM